MNHRRVPGALFASRHKDRDPMPLALRTLEAVLDTVWPYSLGRLDVVDALLDTVYISFRTKRGPQENELNWPPDFLLHGRRLECFQRSQSISTDYPNVLPCVDSIIPAFELDSR